MPQVAIMLPNGTVEKVDRESKESLDALRQVAALLLKAVLQDQFKGIRLGEAVAEEDQFFVDSDKDNQQVSADELEGLERAVKKLAKENLKIELVKVSVDDAVKAVEGDQFSSELLKENAEDGQVSLYKMGDATILALSSSPWPGLTGRGCPLTQCSNGFTGPSSSRRKTWKPT